VTQPEQDSDPDSRTTAGERETTAALVETQMKIAGGLTNHGLIAGTAIALGVPRIVLNLAPSSDGMRWVVVCCAAITGSGIIIVSMAVVIVGYLTKY
jgi:hypothetical protein